MRAVGYVRQSRKSEAGASPEAQRLAIERYAAIQGWTLVDVLEDVGRSGYDPRVRRAGFEEALRLIDGGVERFVVFKLDRLTRQGIGEALAIHDRIKRAGGALVSATESIDTASSMGELIFAIFASMAQQESEKLGERVRSAKAVVRERGGWLGGPVPFGFRPVREDGKTTLVVDPADAAVVRGWIDAVLVEGKSPSQLADTRAGTSAIFYILRSERLRGTIVPADKWRALQLAIAPRAGRRPQQRSLLGGLILCDGCGRTMGGSTANEWPHYRCQYRACTSKAHISMKATDDRVLLALWRNLQQQFDGYAARGWVERGAVLDRVARWWALKAGGLVAEAVHDREDVVARLRRLREMRLAGDFEADMEHYHEMKEDLDAQLMKLAAPAPLPTMEQLEALGRTEARELIRLALEVRVRRITPGEVDEDGVELERIIIYPRVDWPILTRAVAAAGRSLDAS